MYIVAIMITAVIFSVTGLGVMSLSQLVNLDTQTAVHTLQDQIEVESFANVVMWRINAGGDSLGTYTQGDLESSYDSTSMVLTITKNAGDEVSGLTLNLEEDSHFKRAVATNNPIGYSNRTVGEESAHRRRDDFPFLPEVDLNYWLANADSVYTDNNRTFRDWDLIEGILIFSGSNLTFREITLNNTTMIFTGIEIDFYRNNTVSAYEDGSTVNPALVLTNPDNVFYFYEWWWSSQRDHIEGAIYSAGTIVLERGQLSGPLIAENVILWKNMDFLDDQYPEYYQWAQGFGNYEDYDWPKQIALWEPL